MQIKEKYSSSEYSQDIISISISNIFIYQYLPTFTFSKIILKNIPKNLPKVSGQQGPQHTWYFQ